MENQSIGSLLHADPAITPLTLIERQLNEWLEMLDHLRDTHAPMDQLTFCRSQITRLQRDMYRLRKS